MIVRKNEKNSVFSQYGICPSCLNPIQLIGLMHKIKVSPYGKHTGKNINGLPDWNYHKYEYCPFAAKSDRREPSDKFEVLEITDDIIELYNLLKTQFDRIVYIASKELGMKFTDNFLRTALKQYLNDRMYCYPWLTESNLPYMFIYRGMHQQNILGQRFLKGSPLYNALKSHDNVSFARLALSQNSNYMILTKKNKFLKLQLRFSHHTQKAIEGETLKETMKIYIDDMVSGNVLYQSKIQFSETYFINMINKKENADKRQQRILDIANELMPDLC